MNALLQDSMREGNKMKTVTLRSIIAAATVYEKLNPGKPIDYTAVLQTAQKQRQQAIEGYTTAGRQDLVDAETAELAVIESLLPKQMTPEEVLDSMRALDGTDGTIKSLIGAFKAKYPGVASGKDIADAAKLLAV